MMKNRGKEEPIQKTKNYWTRVLQKSIELRLKGLGGTINNANDCETLTLLAENHVQREIRQNSNQLDLLV